MKTLGLLAVIAVLRYSPIENKNQMKLWRSMAESTEPYLEIKSISKRFGATQALDSVNLVLYPGEIHALPGENGAGKSTLIKTMVGITQNNRSFRSERLIVGSSLDKNTAKTHFLLSVISGTTGRAPTVFFVSFVSLWFKSF